MKKFIPIIIVLVLFLLVGGCTVGCSVGKYNSMVELEEQVNQAWSQVENQYQRRIDLIPNLVEVVKGYATHEKDTLKEVIAMRNQATQITVTKEVLEDPQAFKKFQEVQGELSSMLTRLMAITEAYPDLKANENFLGLQSQLEGTENRISVERKRYNEAATIYNTFIRKFPNVIIATFARFNRKELFQAQSGADKAPEISFD